MPDDKIIEKHTRESLYMTMSSIADGIISVDKDRNIVFINRAAQKLTGWGEHEAIGQSLDIIFNVVNSKTREKLECDFAKLLNSREKTSFSYCPILISKSGDEKYISVNLSPIKNENDKVFGAVITFQDVTRHRQIEKELKIERYNLRTQFQYSPAAMVIVDENAVVQDVNDRYIDLFGIINENMIGKNLGNSFGCVSAINNVCGKGQECYGCPIKECICKVIESRIPFRNVEKIYKLIKNGRPAICNLKFSLVPINLSGNIHVLISVDDMTEYRVMEENLRRSRDFYLTLFDEFPAMIWRSKTDKSIDYVNKRWLEFTGRAIKQDLGDGWTENIHPDDVGICVDAFTSSFNKLEPFEMEYRLRRFNGEYRWIVNRAGPYFDLEGNFAGYIGACYDITEQKRARELLKKYELLSEKVRDIILVVETNGRIIEANEAAIRTYGYSRKELLEKTVFDLRRDRKFTQLHLDKAFENGTFFESLHYKKDGGIVPVEVSAQSTILNDSEVVVSIIRDITERKKTEQALKDSEEKFRAIFQNAPYAIFLNEAPERIFPCTHNNFLEVNNTACSILGYNREELLNMCPCEIVYGDFGEKIPDEIEHLFAKDYISYETWYKTRDRRKIPVELSTHAFELSGRKVMLTIANDISERKRVDLEIQRAMEATKAAYKAKSEFLANMSHEIRTPLNGVIGMLDLTMLTELSLDQRDNLATAKNCANSLLNIINDILDFSKIEAGKMTIVHMEFDFRTLIEKIVRVYYYQAKEKGVDLTYQLPADLPAFLVGDPNRLQQVLNNLLSNAVKFTDIGYVSLIIKIVECIDNYVTLQFSVSDTGIGISGIDMDKLFKSFSQIDASQTRKFGGAGLGLAITKHLIGMMGGTLKVESEKEKGSTFSFSLRYVIGERASVIVDCIEPKGFNTARKEAKILIVEADKVNQIVISRMLREMGYKYDIACCGNDALKLLEQSFFDLCLMDIQMPELDGLQTVGIIRQNEQKDGRHMPIVAITAHVLQGDCERFLETGMDDYISKPFQMTELFILIEKLLAVHDGKNDSGYNMISSKNPVNIFEMKSFIKNYAYEIKPIITEICNNIDKLRHAIKNENIEKIEETAHNIKALASSISADKVKTLAFRIELAARRGNQSEAALLYEDLNDEFGKYEISINEAEDSI